MFTMILEIVLIIYVLIRRKRFDRDPNENKRCLPGDEFQYFVLAFVHQMKTEGNLKSTTVAAKEAKKSLKDQNCLSKSKEIAKDIARYFAHTCDLVEGPYFGFNAAEKDPFRFEENVSLTELILRSIFTLVFAEVVIAGSFVIKGVRIVMGKPKDDKPGGPFISFPAQKGKGAAADKYFELAHPVTAEARKAVQECVLRAYAKAAASTVKA